MKKGITLQQWKEAIIECRRALVLHKNPEWKDIIDERLEAGCQWLMDIGEMIEFLGNDWWKQIYENDYYNMDLVKNDKLADALWEAVNYKLK